MSLLIELLKDIWLGFGTFILILCGLGILWVLFAALLGTTLKVFTGINCDDCKELKAKFNQSDRLHGVCKNSYKSLEERIEFLENKSRGKRA